MAVLRTASGGVRPLDRAGTLTRGVLDEDGEAGGAVPSSTGGSESVGALLRASSIYAASSASTPLDDDVRVPPKQCVMATPSPPKARGPLAWLVGGGI